MARPILIAAMVCCVSLLAISGTFAQDLGGRANRPIEAGPIDVARITQRADLVVHGFVTAKRADWVGRVLYTVYDVAVQDTLKGTPRSTVAVAVVGGARGNVRLTVPGAPDLQAGAQVVLFVTPLQGTTLTPVGTFDGIVRVTPARGRSGATVAPRGRPESLDTFLEEVRALGGRR